MNFDTATARRLYEAGYRNGHEQGEQAGYIRGYGDGHQAGTQAQAITDAELIEALAWAQRDLDILNDARTATIRSTIADIQALNYRNSRPRRTAA